MSPPRTDFRPAGFIVVRTPSLPFETLRRWSAGVVSSADPSGERADQLASDATLLTGRLRELTREPFVREALFCASPTLDEAITAWHSDPDHPRAAGVIPILVRYLTRMAARPTPFGLFSGCSLGTVDSSSRLVIAPRAAWLRHSRLDMDYLTTLVEALHRDDSLRAHLDYHPSTGLYRRADQYRYAEAHIEGNRERHYDLVSVDAMPALDVALRRAADGASSSDLAAAIVDRSPEISSESALAFVDQLVESQILVPELMPPVTGPEPVLAVIETLRAKAPDAPALRILQATREELAAMDHAGVGLPTDRYRVLAKQLEALPAPVDLARLFQVDLTTRSDCALGNGAVAEIARGVELLRNLAPSLQHTALDLFHKAFVQRYNTRSVALVEALDEELGIGFAGAGNDASPLRDGFAFPAPADSEEIRIGARERHLVRAYSDLLRRGDRVWHLDDADLEALTSTPPATLPDSFAAIAVFAARSTEALDCGDFAVSVRFGGWGAGLLGRFCHGDDALRREVEVHLRAEEALRPDAVFAEVVHLPEGRLGNVICRPLLRKYEIPYLGRSGAAPECRIPIEDLYLHAEQDRIVVTSKRLGREVIPSLANAHNHPTSSLAIYRFLCAVRAPRAHTLAWSWGPLESVSWQPRVMSGRVVLSLARWKITGPRLAELAKARAGQAFAKVQALRTELDLPRWVCLVEFDNVLAIDLDNVLSVETFVSLVKKRSEAVVVELFPDPEDLCTHGPGGRFIHEIVVPFVRTEAGAATFRSYEAVIPAVPVSGTIERTFSPGSEWLSAKIYTGTASADRVLGEIVAPLARDAVATGRADRWFFLRYNDPEWHLRFRLHGANPHELLEVAISLREALAPWQREGRVRQIELTTYEREIERYGGDNAIELIEQIFHADSEAVVDLLDLLDGDADARWRLTLVGMHRMFCDFGFAGEERLRIARMVRDSFAAEFRVQAAFEHQLGARFRQERASLESLLRLHPSVPPPPAVPYERAFEILEERSSRCTPLMLELRCRAERGEITELTRSIAPSLVHMHINRLLRADQREQELILYDFLIRCYQSAAARARRQPS